MNVIDPVYKHCPQCSNVLPLSRFGRNSNNPDGYTTYCRECQNERQREWKANHPDKVRKWRRAYIKRNKERNRERA